MKHRQGTCDNVAEEDLETLPLLSGKGKKPLQGPLAWAANVLGLDALADKFGYKLLVMLFASQHLMKGFAGALMGPCSSYLYKAYNVAGPQMQIYGGVTQLPWAMKPIIGLLSDALPIRGFHKSPYILGASAVGAVSLALIGASTRVHLTVTMLVICMFFVQLQFSTCDLLTEAKYAEKMQSNPEHGPKLMTFVWFGLQTGGLAATMMVGPMLSHYGPHFPYLVALVPATFIMIPMARNYMEEVPRNSEELQEARAKLMRQKEACFLCLLMFVGTILLTFLGTFYESTQE